MANWLAKRMPCVNTSEPTRDRYRVDTCSFVDIERRPSLAARRESIWALMHRLIEQRRVDLLDIVLDELDRNVDDPHFERCVAELSRYRRSSSVIRAKVLLTPMSSPELAEIFTRFGKMSGIGKPRLKADPYLVYFGMADGYVVVTEESRSSASKIPAACAHFDVECISLADLIERERR